MNKELRFIAKGYSYDITGVMFIRCWIQLWKGDKERKACFDAKTKLPLMNYIKSRTDNNKALFVSLNKLHKRLTDNGCNGELTRNANRVTINKKGGDDHGKNSNT